MKVALITDTHWGARGDSREFLDYFTRFYREVFWPEVRKRGIKTVVHLGDIVDRRKFINFVTLNTMKREFIDVAKYNGVGLHIIVGNHDIPFRNTNAINAIQETCEDQPHIKLYSEPEVIEIGSASILMMPWINSTNYSQCFDIIKNTNAPIMFGHLEIKGFEMYRGVPSHEGYDESLFSKFAFVASGHFHKKTDRGNIHYLGAPYEMTWSDYNCPRGFHIFDTETMELEYVRNTLHMFHKVWYNDTETVPDNGFEYLKDSYVKVIIQAKNNPVAFDQWINKIYDAKPLDVSVVDDHRNMQLISDEDIIHAAEDTPTVLRNYVKSMETAVNKNDLDNLLITIYNEALMLDQEEAA